MSKVYEYKLQGNGRDSWKVTDTSTGEIYMTYEAPSREIANWKLKAVLDTMGLLPNINAAIAALSEPNRTFATYAWEYSQTVDQFSPTVKLIQQACALSDEQVNNIFNTAEGINI
jgi:hypothetical protein